MHIILLQDVRGVGRKNEIKSVSDGYARNFLIPRKLALAADEQGMAAKQVTDAKEEAERARLAALAARLSGITLEFTIKTGEHHEVFGSVSKRDIEEKLRAAGVTEGHVVLDHPIKSTGKHMVLVDFGKGVKGAAKVTIDSA